ncbi:putative copper radical oxidase variant A [Lyophyllum shimeji]|uniref:Copper radical oxidase variant A n=1 Tax=Lyophyllum shimeji TaxID=47721 RepID=A0A9P3PS91_LYOSH|nr:putative copper radical oxidase variant A [Lyophyllum shimeji]
MFGRKHAPGARKGWREFDVQTMHEVVLAELHEEFATVVTTEETVASSLIDVPGGNNEKVYILDNAEGNPATVSGHPAWGSVWDIKTKQATVMDVKTNTFCSSGMHLPNGSYVTFGGNGAVGRGGVAGSTGVWDAEYQDFDGAKSIRVLNPCTSSDNFASAQCT